jgi:itaconyl-CoA hydratase
MTEHFWKGRYYEDFVVGDVYKHWPGKTILDADNHWFTLLTLNTNPIHFDESYAQSGEWGKTLVNSCYTLSLVVGMSVRDISQNNVANLGFEDVKFVAPVYAGDTLYAETTVLETRPSKSRPTSGIIYVETRAVNQHGKQVMSLKRPVMVKTRAYDAPTGGGQ